MVVQRIAYDVIGGHVTFTAFISARRVLHPPTRVYLPVLHRLVVI